MRRQIRDRRMLGYGSGGSGAGQPAVSSIYPAVGWRRGSGLTVTISGSGFSPVATVTINGLAATGVTFISPSTITCLTPTFAGDGVFDVVVTNPNTLSSTLPSAYLVLQSAAWFKQSLGVTLDGSSKVQSMSDQSGNAADISQATAGNRPIVSTAYRNGKNAINFAGSNVSLQNSATSLIASGAALTCLYCGNGGNIAGSLLSIRLAGSGFSLDVSQAGTNLYYMVADTVGAFAQSDAPDAAILADHYSSYHMPDRVSSHVTYFLNGTSRTMTSNGTFVTETGTDGFVVCNNPIGSPLKNEMLEMVIIAGNVTTQQRQAWEAYCRTEYALP